MNIQVKFSATKVEKPYKANVHSLLTIPVTYSYSSKFGNGYFYNAPVHGEEYILAINWQKVNRKVKSSKKVKKIWNGVEVTTTKRTYHPAKWVMYYYKIPVSFLFDAKLKVKQGNRTFKLIKSK